MATYIGSKRVGSVSDYNKLSTSEKVIATRDPEIAKILIGQPTASDILSKANNPKNRKIKVNDQGKYLRGVQEQNYKILAETQARMLKSWEEKYKEAGANFNDQGVQVQQSAVDQRNALDLAQPQTQDNTMLYVIGAIALLGALK